jgi:hypothetical protein
MLLFFLSAPTDIVHKLCMCCQYAHTSLSFNDSRMVGGGGVGWEKSTSFLPSSETRQGNFVTPLFYDSVSSSHHLVIILCIDQREWKTGTYYCISVETLLHASAL